MEDFTLKNLGGESIFFLLITAKTDFNKLSHLQYKSTLLSVKLLVSF